MTGPVSAPWRRSSPLLERGWRVLRHRGVRATVAGAVDEVRARVELRHHRRRPAQAFVVHDVELRQLVHLHNRTWRNERAVEVPLALAFLDRQPGPVLELGNVLGHYGRTGHLVVDKYERRPGVVNVDVVDFRTADRFGAVVSISTLEHVGWDEEPRDPGKIPRAVAHLQGLLRPEGRMLVTCPLAHNPHLDALIAQGGLGADRQALPRRLRRAVGRSGPRRGVRLGPDGAPRRQRRLRGRARAGVSEPA